MENLFHESIRSYYLYCYNMENILVDHGYKYSIGNINEKMQIINKNDYSFTLFASFDDEIDCRNEAIYLLNKHDNLIKSLFALYVQSGYQQIKNDNKFISGIYLSDNFIKILEIDINKQLDKYVLNATFNGNIIDAVFLYQKEYKLLSPNIDSNYLGVILFENNTSLEKEIKKIFPKYQTSLSHLRIQEKFAYLEDVCSIIIEIRSKNRLKIKNVYSNQEVNSSLETLENDVNLIKKELIEELYKVSLNNALKALKKQEYICENCIGEVNEYILKPFNQRLVNKKCKYCLKEAKYSYLITEKGL